MPNHKPHTYSHEDVLFLLETLAHCKDFIWPNYTGSANLQADVNRCIKILEKDDE